MMRKIIFYISSMSCCSFLSSVGLGRVAILLMWDVRVARYDRLQYEYVTMNSFSAFPGKQ